MMLKRQVIKTTTAVVALLAYAMGSLVCSLSSVQFQTNSLRDVLGFFFWHESGILSLLNSFVWIAAIFFLGLSLMGFWGILPLIYCKMYALGVSVTAAIIMKGTASLAFLAAVIPEVLLIFFIFTELGSGAISFSIYILQRLSLLPRRREQLIMPKERISFREYVSGGAIALFLASLLAVYENTVIAVLS